MQAEARGIAHHVAHLVLRVAEGGQVELIGLVDELHDAIEVEVIEETRLQSHLEPGEVAGEVGRLRALRPTFAVGGIELVAIAILRGHRKRLEVTGGGQPRWPERGILRHLGHGDLRQGLAHQVPLKRVVIEEHQRIDADR